MSDPRNGTAVGARGQALAEFGLALPILLLLIMSIVDLGHMVAIHAATITAADEGARYGATVGDNGSGTPRYVDCPGIRQASRALTTGLVTIGDAQISISYDNGTGAPTTQACPPDGTGPVPAEISNLDRVVVQVTVTYGPISPLVSAFVGPVTVTAVDRRTIVKADP